MDKEPTLDKEKEQITFDSLKSAAQEENWELVDSHVTEYSNMPETINWALTTDNEGIKSSDENIRDLAVSLVEKSDCKLSEKNVADLMFLLETDKNIYVQFRSAFALFTHGDRSPKIIKKIESALEDENVSEIAKNYLSQIK